MSSKQLADEIRSRLKRIIAQDVSGLRAGGVLVGGRRTRGAALPSRKRTPVRAPRMPARRSRLPTPYEEYIKMYHGGAAPRARRSAGASSDYIRFLKSYAAKKRFPYARAMMEVSEKGLWR